MLSILNSTLVDELRLLTGFKFALTVAVGALAGNSYFGADAHLLGYQILNWQ